MRPPAPWVPWNEADLRACVGVPVNAAIVAEPAVTFPQQPVWMGEAACAGTKLPELFFLADYALIARALCIACPVRAKCLDYALQQDPYNDHGVWGGTTPQERAALRTVSA